MSISIENKPRDFWALEFEFKSAGTQEPGKIFEQRVASSELHLQKMNTQQHIQSFLFRGCRQSFICTRLITVSKNYHSRITFFLDNVSF